MFYPACYVYKIASMDDSTTNNDTTSSNKKCDVTSTKKPKNPPASSIPSPTNITTLSDLLSNGNKNENQLIKNLSNQLLISAQRNNCIDPDKRQEAKVNNVCLSISDPMSRRTCRCHQCLGSASRLSSFLPFHRRPRLTPPAHSDPSTRTKTEPIKSENPSDSIDHLHPSTQTDPSAASQSTSSPIVTHSIPSNQPITTEKATDWTAASTPNSVSMSGPPSVLAPITNLNSIQTTSPAPANTSARGLKRSATTAFDDLSIVEDEEREQHKQTYDFHRTDSFLQLPLKRFRADNESTIHSSQMSLTINNASALTTSDHLYRHGQPTPPSPSHLLSRLVRHLSSLPSINVSRLLLGSLRVL